MKTVPEMKAALQNGPASIAIDGECIKYYRSGILSTDLELCNNSVSIPVVVVGMHIGR